MVEAKEISVHEVASAGIDQVEGYIFFVWEVIVLGMVEKRIVDEESEPEEVSIGVEEASIPGEESNCRQDGNGPSGPSVSAVSLESDWQKLKVEGEEILILLLMESIVVVYSLVKVICVT
jgi:hypothetical protein